MQGTIYALASPDGEIRYCGKTAKQPNHRMHAHKRDARQYRHRHVCNWLRSIYEAGQEPKMIICEVVKFDGLDRTAQLAKLNEAERRWIEQLKALGFRLTNGTNGGDGAHGRKVSEETRRKTAASNRGKKRAGEALLNVQRAARDRRKDYYKSGPNNPLFGRKAVWSDPTARVANIQAARSAWSEEQRLANYAKAKGNKNASKLTQEQVDEIRASKLTQSVLAKMYGVSQPAISAIKARKRWPQLEIN